MFSCHGQLPPVKKRIEVAGVLPGVTLLSQGFSLAALGGPGLPLRVRVAS